MERKNRPEIFLITLGVIVLVILAHNFIRFYIAKDYPLHVFTDCDSAIHSCFQADAEVADPTFQAKPYAKVEISAAYAPHCLDEHNCNNFTCDGISGSCSLTYCSDDTKEEGENCTSTNQ